MPLGKDAEKPTSIMGITGLYKENVCFIVFTHTDKSLSFIDECKFLSLKIELRDPFFMAVKRFSLMIGVSDAPYFHSLRRCMKNRGNNH